MFNLFDVACSRISRPIVPTKRQLKTATGRLAILAASMAVGLGLTVSARGALVTDVTSIQTQMFFSSDSTQTGIHGAGVTSGYSTSRSYNMNYLGKDLEITKLTTAAGSYVPTALATTVIERGSGPTNDTIFYAGYGASTASTINLSSAPVSSVANAFSGNNLLVGADNVFSNTGNLQNNNSNIERIDLLFSGGITASSNDVFSIFERGFSNQHDGFQIAAITALDQNGNPSAYGTLLSLATGSYGKEADVSQRQYIVTRKNDSITGDKEHPSDTVSQPIGGVVIPTNALVSNGKEIFGYSLFASDVTGSGAQLVNWNDTQFFPDNTPESKGGLDLMGTAAVLYAASSSNSSIPEPATGALALISASGLIVRRSKHRRV